MQTIDVQLIGGVHDGMITEVTAQELRMDEAIFMPCVPPDSEAEMDVAYTEYVRMIYGTQAGQIISYVKPTLRMDKVQKTVKRIIAGDRSADGMWLMQESGLSGNLQITPLVEIQ